MRFSEGTVSQSTFTANDDEFSRKLLRPWSISSHPSIRSRSSTLNDSQFGSTSAVETDDASSRRGLLASGTWARFGGRSSEEISRDPEHNETNFAYGGRGWWKHQMLADRSFRTMAALTSVFAFILLVICFTHLTEFAHRANKNSTSVGGKANSTCGSMEGKNVVLHLVINIAATMILGMSNTYQQLVTSLSTGEIRWVLSKHGDSRVGTNSPFNISHKKTKKVQAWAQWILLIVTSVPVHFLANSVIGPSIYIHAPENIIYTLVDHSDPSLSYGSYFGQSEETKFDRGCWLAFRTGTYSLSQSVSADGYYFEDELNSWQDDFVNVTHSKACGQFINTTTLPSMRNQEYNHNRTASRPWFYEIGDCKYPSNVSCSLNDHNLVSPAKGEMCRLSIRMFAAITLAACLTIKAVYMVAVNVLARRKIKTKCLTFGDVIAASALDSSLQIRNECMVNAFDGHRHLVKHTCHPKHCRPDATPSETGDAIGHCQKCRKFNEINQAADLVHPSIAIKYKKSLIGNLAGNAVSQMATLMICTCAMFGISLMLAVSVGSSASDFKYRCAQINKDPDTAEMCKQSLSHYLKYSFGYFGGFDTAASLGSLTINSLDSEIAAFAISNGAQVIYSILYLLLIYNFTLIIMEHDWGKLEMERRQLRCTIVEGEGFKQSYLLQLPKRILYPMMAFSSMMHWLLAQSISTKETIWADKTDPLNPFEVSSYDVVYGAYAVWLSTALMLAQTGVCWWCFTYSREGFMPQMYGSIRACCAATSELTTFPKEGTKWGDLGEGKKFRHAGFSANEVGAIVPAELYCGRDFEGTNDDDTLRKKELDRKSK